MSSITSGLSTLAKRGAIVFGGLGIAAAGFGISSAASFQQTRIAFEGILGSAQKAQSFLDQMRRFAASTPFEFPELADAAKNLLAVGFNTEEVIPTMTKLGNVAATLGVGGAEIQGVVRALGQMKGKGKASAEELQQISEQLPGFSAIKAIAEDMGVSVEEAFEQMSKGAIPADRAVAAILKGMEKFPGAAGAMERQSKTLNGVLSTFKDTIRDTLINAIEPFLPTLSAGITKITPIFQGALGTLTTGISAAAKAFSGEGITSDGFVGFMERIGVAIRSVVTIVQDNLPRVRAILGTVFANVGEIVGGHIIPTFTELARRVIPQVVKIVSSLARIWATVLLPAIRDVAVFARAHVVPVVEALSKAVAAFVGFLADHGPTVRTFAKVALGLLVARFAALKINAAVTGIKAFGGQIAKEGKSVLSFAQSVRAVVANIASFTGRVVVATAKLIAHTAVWVAHKAATLAVSAAQKTLTAAQWALNVAMNANPIGLIVTGIAALAVGFVVAYKKIKPFRDAVNFVGRLLLGFFRFVKAKWPLLLAILTGPFGIAALLIVKHWKTIRDATAKAIGAIVDFFQKLPGRIVAGLARIGEIIWGGLRAGFDFVKRGILRVIDAWVTIYVRFPIRVLRAIGNLGRKIWNAIVAGFRFLGEKTRELIGRLVGFFRDYAPRVVRAVANFGRRVWRGLVAGSDWIEERVRERVGRLVGFFRELPGRIVRAVTNFGRTVWNGLKAGFQFVREQITSKVDGIVGFFRGLPGRIADAAIGMFDGIKDAFKDAINWIIRGWNSLEFKIPGFDPPGPGPTFDGFTLGVPDIPQLRLGGVTTAPIIAQIGDNLSRREAVIPLDDQRALSQIRDALAPRLIDSPAAKLAMRDEKQVHYHLTTLQETNAPLSEQFRRMELLEPARLP